MGKHTKKLVFSRSAVSSQHGYGQHNVVIGMGALVRLGELDDDDLPSDATLKAKVQVAHADAKKQGYTHCVVYTQGTVALDFLHPKDGGAPFCTGATVNAQSAGFQPSAVTFAKVAKAMAYMRDEESLLKRLKAVESIYFNGAVGFHVVKR